MALRRNWFSQGSLWSSREQRLTCEAVPLPMVGAPIDPADWKRRIRISLKVRTSVPELDRNLDRSAYLAASAARTNFGKTNGTMARLSPTSRLQASFGVLPKRPEGRSRWGVSCVGVWRTLEASCGSPRRSEEPCDLVQKHAAEISPFNCCMPGILSVSFCTK